MSEPNPETNAVAKPERTVRALPVIAVSSLLVTAAVVLVLGRVNAPTRTATTAVERRVDEPTPVNDTDHYVPGSPPAVAERLLRAWMRGRYEEARELATGPLRARAERELQEVANFTPDQREEFRRTRVYVDATRYELEHVTIEDLPPSSEGRPRKVVRGQAHAQGEYGGTRIDSRRGQTFTLELVDGAWRVSDRTWETFERDR